MSSFNPSAPVEGTLNVQMRELGLIETARGRPWTWIFENLFSPSKCFFFLVCLQWCFKNSPGHSSSLESLTSTGAVYFCGQSVAMWQNALMPGVMLAIAPGWKILAFAQTHCRILNESFNRTRKLLTRRRGYYKKDCWFLSTCCLSSPLGSSHQLGGIDSEFNPS